MEARYFQSPSAIKKHMHFKYILQHVIQCRLLYDLYNTEQVLYMHVNTIHAKLQFTEGRQFPQDKQGKKSKLFTISKKS